MDLRDLILKTEAPAVEEKPAEKKKTMVDYSVEVQSGCDFAIRRKTSKSEKLMVILVSQKQFYIKDCKDGSIKDLDAQGYADFMSDCHENILLPEVSWLDSIQRGKDNGQTLINEIDAIIYGYQGSQYDFAKKGYYVPCRGTRYHYDDLCNVRELFKKMPTLYMYAIDKIAEHLGISRKKVVLSFKESNSDSPVSKATAVVKEFETPLILATAFGIEWGKKYIDTVLITGVDCNIEEQTLSRILIENNDVNYRGYGDEKFEQRLQKIADKKANNEIHYDVETFIEYITYDAMRQGYRTNVNYFVNTWADYLYMARNAYRRAKIEKYPDYLLSEHQKMVAKKNLYEEKINELKWQTSAERMLQYEWKPGGQKYQIVSPRKPEDMYDEAQQQQNCLASYVKRVTNGETLIFFLRSSKKELADKSIVTIEVYPNGKVGQVLAKNNHRPSFDQLHFVKLWADSKGFEYSPM